MNENKIPDEKEIKIVQLLANDCNHAQIAVEVGCSVRSVESATKKIRAAWGVKSLPAICVFFYKNGWIQ